MRVGKLGSYDFESDLFTWSVRGRAPLFYLEVIFFRR